MSRWIEEKKQVLEAAAELLAKGLVVGTSGNISLRLPADDERQLIAITPGSLYYDSMKIEDIQVVDFRGQTVEGNLTPSTETRLHIAIYQAREKVNAVIHTHSVFASALSVAGMDIPPIMEDQVAFLGGEIKLAKQAVSGSREQINYVLAALENRNAVLLPNHGAVGIGQTMRDAFTAGELIEKTAKIYLLARLAGKVEQLPTQLMEAMLTIFNKSPDT